MDLLFLGTGTSFGIPMIGCKCAVCTSKNPKDRRSRPSALLQYAGRNVLIDTAVELREQLLAADIGHVDAVLYTHAHADHIFGFDDLRAIGRKGAVPLYADAGTAQTLRETFRYVFDGGEAPSEVPKAKLNVVNGPFDLFGESVWPIELLHGKMPVLGYRVHDVAYLTDCSMIPDASLRMLGNLEVLVIDAVRFRPHPTHFSVDEALEVISILKPKRAFLTHLCHDIEHDAVSAMLPAGTELAYDGLRVTVK
jgi:phosphoribosyl 1,2-cyclic phosphate phosphodiesterase